MDELGNETPSLPSPSPALPGSTTSPAYSLFESSATPGLRAQPSSFVQARTQPIATVLAGTAPPGSSSTIGAQRGPDSQQQEDGAARTRRLNPALVHQPTFFSDRRHMSGAVPDTTLHRAAAPWKHKTRMKTVAVGLVLCLNIGVDPPDVIKPKPCAKLECWIDPTKQASQKSLEAIGKSLQVQYERWQDKAKYKQCLDPTVEDVKKLCQGHRRTAKDDRVLFHYNGHGVPQPTHNGEIWVFNKNYTQYIPLSIYDLQTWLGHPSIYVFDCNCAGLIVSWYQRFMEQRPREEMAPPAAQPGSSPMSPPPAAAAGASQDFILLAACGENELLPMNPDYPADIFTACLTTPIRIALLWFCKHSRLHKIPVETIERVPGIPNNRRTPLGELNWIFTTITDTIAWNILPRDLFQKLFRQDLLVASLVRNFLLAERIMRSLNCVPVSVPRLPPAFKHPLWEAWDLAVDMCLAQMPRLIADPTAEYIPSTFFAEQLTAFEVWLEFGSEDKSPPEQLPVVLQVLLSQTYRHQALHLLCRFLDMGPWASVQALSVGIFPYVLKLLMSQAPELREVLVFIWTKLLVHDGDKSCQQELLREGGHPYFIGVLSTTSLKPQIRTMAAFILTAMMDKSKSGQEACMQAGLLPVCVRILQDPDQMLRKWAVLCLAKLWENLPDAKWAAIQLAVHEKLCNLLSDHSAEVRASAIYALGTFIGNSSASMAGGVAGGGEARANIEVNICLGMFVAMADGSSVVRRELVIAVSKLIASHIANFADVARETLEEERERVGAESKKSRKKYDDADSGSPVQSPSSSVGGVQTPTTPRGSSGSATGPSASSSAQAAAAQQQQTQQRAKIVETPDDDSSAASSVYAWIWKETIRMTADPFADVMVVAEKLVQSVYKYLDGLSKRQSGVPQASTTWKKIQTTGLRRREPDAPSPTGPSPPLVAPQGMMGGVGGMPVADEISIKSEFYEWSSEYFFGPLLSNPLEDRTSPEYKAKEQRQAQNFAVIREARDTWTQWNTEKRKLETEVTQMPDGESVVSLLLFHPFRNLLVVSDEKDCVSVWDWFTGKKLNMFSNLNPLTTRITSLSFANEHDSSSLLLVGSDDGVVRVWKDFTLQDRKMVSSWKALPDLIPRGIDGSGLLMDWLDSSSGQLLTSGDVGVVRVWDVSAEINVQEIPTNCDRSVTAIAVDRASGSNRNFVIGCGDGSVRLFDTRIAPRASCVATSQEHKRYILNVGISGTSGCVISGSSSGEIKIWDISGTRSSSTVVHESMTSLAVHSHAPIIASGSAMQRINVYNMSGECLNSIKYHEGFIGQRIGPVSCLAFHPYKAILAAGCTDSSVTIFSDGALKHN